MYVAFFLKKKDRTNSKTNLFIIQDIIQSFVFADDVVSKLSYGSMMDVKELIIAGSEAARNLGISEILWSGDPVGEKWQAAFKQIAEVRERCLNTMDNPRVKLYTF